MKMDKIILISMLRYREVSGTEKEKHLFLSYMDYYDL
jgi:hypothetical protein